MKQPAIYILTNAPGTVLYIGVTSNLQQRIYQHRHHLLGGFTKRYQVTKLVHYELHDEMQAALRREKALKKWPRHWKNQLITEHNQYWHDLWEQIIS